ncbi:mRNA interferase YafQ [Enterococcus sp. AZ194]|uniref:type II toxin-antitoxin system YafQ family toxin n=1 Tax=Enterococcus sp. AZ194 TaxID=2774629 RepID=UPI003F23FC80
MMNKLTIKQTPTFVREFKRIKKKHYDMELLKAVVKHLVNRDDEILRNKYKDHALKGNHKGYRELHIIADWLLMYKILNKELILVLIRTGSHDEIL